MHSSQGIAVLARRRASCASVGPSPRPGVGAFIYGGSQAMKQALIVIDVQESFRRRPYFRDEELPRFLRNVQSLIDRCAARGIALLQVFRSIGELLISGIRTEQCCETTTRHASDRGFTV